MYLITIRITLLVLFTVIASGIAHAQGDPLADESARVNALTKSGNEKLRNKDFDGALADFNEVVLTAEPPSPITARRSKWSLGSPFRIAGAV
jgi:hypothetical protein